MTINEVTTQTGGAIANFSDDPFMDFGIEAATAGATFLKFEKDGSGYTYGQDRKLLPHGTKLLANMGSMRTGWVRWQGGMPTDKVLNLVAERRPKVSREELGDLDPQMWEDRTNDPWKEAAELDLADGYGQKYIFSTTSGGGLKAVKKLSYDYARERRSRPGQMPLIELSGDYYEHPKYGKTHVPVLTIVDWVDADSIASARGGSIDEPLPAQEKSTDPVVEKPTETKSKGPVPVLKAKGPRF
jgi:hypothetical protein